ncbi:MAG: hypothetical protein JSS27_05825 [Planctomycetes bacterium]|nr:hypothetical protein [Planctomycetota bacterium]
MRRAWLLSIAVVLALTPCAGAQAPNDPYADGLNKGLATGWPPFYKPLKITPRDQLYYAMGWCRTNHYKYKPEDLVVVDKLPEAEYEGKVEQVAEAALTIAPKFPSTKPTLVFTHPAATRITITGKAERAALKPGQYLRFTATIDERGRAVEPVRELEIVAADEAKRVGAVEANKQVPVVGRLGQVHGNELKLTIAEGKIRAVTIALASDAAIELFTSELAYANPGDKLSVKGRVYHPDNAPDETDVYATELTIERAETLTAPLSARRKPLATASK